MSLMNNSKARRLCLLFSMVLLAGVIGFRLLAPNARELARDADRRADAMYDAYCEALFDTAFAAIDDYIDYLEKHKHQIVRYRQVDGMLFSAHMRAGYMLLHTEDSTRAYSHLDAAYEYHRNHRSPRNVELVPRNEFIDFAISAGAEVERRYAVLWKKQASIETNVVEAVKTKFR